MLTTIDLQPLATQIMELQSNLRNWCMDEQTRIEFQKNITQLEMTYENLRRMRNKG